MDLTEFDVPVGEVDEMAPAIVWFVVKRDVKERLPAWPFGFAFEFHADLMREAVGFFRITTDAGADDVFPGGLAALVPGDDMVQI